MIQVVYNQKQVADPGDQPIVKKGLVPSPSAGKPRIIAEALFSQHPVPNVLLIDPIPVHIDDIKLCHDATYVDTIMDLTEPNGFGTFSASVNNSLLFTNGAMLTAAQCATKTSPACALVSGFHHAGYDSWEKFGWFCTFNGLMITAAKLAEGGLKTAIIDCDQHHGNGTDDILERLPKLLDCVTHFSFGKFLHTSDKAEVYLDWLKLEGHIHHLLQSARPDIILYQAGADVHINDPYGGVLNTEQIMERDVRMFTVAKTLNIPIAWNLAGGYQIEPDGSIGKVIEIHLNTFRACQQVYA